MQFTRGGGRCHVVRATGSEGHGSGCGGCIGECSTGNLEQDAKRFPGAGAFVSRAWPQRAERGEFEVDDVEALFAHVKQFGASINNGPNFDKNAGFWFGGFSDPEGNPFWVVDKNCP